MKHRIRDYTVISKVGLVICLCLIMLAIVNAFTGFINSAIQISGTLTCIMGCLVAVVEIVILEDQRRKK